MVLSRDAIVRHVRGASPPFDGRRRILKPDSFKLRAGRTRSWGVTVPLPGATHGNPQAGYLWIIDGATTSNSETTLALRATTRTRGSSCRAAKDDMNLQRIAKALTSSTRLAVLRRVGAEPTTATRVAAELGISISTASRSLHILRRAGLLESYVHSRERRFRLPRRRRLVIGVQRIDGLRP